MRKSTILKPARLMLVLPLVLAGFGSTIAPASAQTYSNNNGHKCANHKKKKNKKILGAIGGAALGGFVGRKIDGGKHHEVGTIAGALGGAYLGQAVVGSMTKCDRYFQDQAAVRSIQTGQTQSWSNSDSGAVGEVRPSQTFISKTGRQCKTVITRNGNQNGYYDPQTIAMCRDADGYWSRI